MGVFDLSEYFGLTAAELDDLSKYNAERGRGLLHTPEYDAKMAVLQTRFYDARRSSDGPT